MEVKSNESFRKAVIFDNVESIDTKDIAELKVYLSASNKIYSFIRMDNNQKFYLHNVNSSKYQFALSTDKTHKNRQVNIKYFTKISQILKLANDLGIETITIDFNSNNLFYIVNNSFLITKHKTFG